MKIVVIWSSPNTAGLTATAKDRFISGLKKTGATVEDVHLNALNIATVDG